VSEGSRARVSRRAANEGKISNLTGYAMDRAAAERDRLSLQDRISVRHSENVFRWAGVAPADRVHDAGFGTGDTTRLPAEMVGPSGELPGRHYETTAEIVTGAGRKSVLTMFPN
jgi:predicted methyltransferase